MKSREDKLVSSEIIKSIRQKKSLFWEKTEARYSLDVFEFAKEKVPAYKQFLKTEKIISDDFDSLPAINKKNYLNVHSLTELTADGKLNKPLVFTATSGSTGNPFYFHRSFDLDSQASIIHELFYSQGNYKKDEPVLVIVCFGMGIWIGGMITYESFHLMQQRGYNVSIATPGINKDEIFKILKNLGKSYKNIILAGYPPFIKDIVDEAPSQGITWSKFNIRVIFAAEAFTENFRDYIVKNLHIKNPLLDTMNIYGTADLGAMAFETPLAILIRRLCAKNKSLFRTIFNDIAKTPTLAQYIPSSISFTTKGENILVTAKNTIPLVKYSLGDHGGKYYFSEITKKFADFGINLQQEIKKAGLEKFDYELPFVYVYEREDLSAKVYGAIIYPEPIRQALLDKPVSSYLTGKFTLIVKHDKKEDQYMEINCELKNGKKSITTLKNRIKKIIIEKLLDNNSEYANNFRALAHRVEPRVVLWHYQNTTYFTPGVKQKWIKK